MLCTMQFLMLTSFKEENSIDFIILFLESNHLLHSIDLKLAL